MNVLALNFKKMEKILWVILSNLKTSYFWRVEIELDLIELCFCKSHFQTNVFLILKGILYLWNWYNCRQFIICALDSRVLYDRVLKVNFFSKLPPFWIMNEELQEHEIQNHIKTILNKNFFIYISCFEFIVCYLESLLDLMIKLGGVKFLL